MIKWIYNPSMPLGITLTFGSCQMTWQAVAQLFWGLVELSSWVLSTIDWYWRIVYKTYVKYSSVIVEEMLLNLTITLYQASSEGLMEEIFHRR